MAAPRGAACRPCVSVAWLEFGCSQGVGASVLASSRPIRNLSAEVVSLRCVGWFGGVCQLANARSANWHIPLRTPTGLCAACGLPAAPGQALHRHAVNDQHGALGRRFGQPAPLVVPALHRADAGRAGDAAAVPRPQLGDDDARILAGSEARLGLLTHRRPGVRPGPLRRCAATERGEVGRQRRAPSLRHTAVRRP